MNTSKLSATFSAKLVLGIALSFLAACSSDNSDSGNPGGVDGAFSTQAVWESSCLDSDRFGLTMVSRFVIEGEAFTRTNRYHSDGSCSDLAVESVEEGTLARKASAEGSPSGEIDLNYQRVDVTPMSAAGILSLNTVSYCGMNTWQVSQQKNITGRSGANCWDQTPRTIRDIYYVRGNDLYFGVGSEKQKSGSASRPTAPDESRPWKIR